MKITPIKFLRSLVYNKRPDPTKLLDGQPTVNTNSSQPGLFFRGANSNALFKVGPCHVGEYAPNSPVDPAGAGDGSNCLGEMWFDQNDGDGPTLKVFDNTGWKPANPIKYARVIIQDTTPNAVTLDLLEGTLWWNSGNGLMYILYGSGPDGRWIQIASSVAS